MQARQLSALSTEKSLMKIPAVPGSLAYLAHQQHFGSSLGPTPSKVSSTHLFDQHYDAHPGQAHSQGRLGELEPGRDRRPGLHLNMDVGGMQLPAPGTSGGGSPTSF